jgi:hypothetical protein
MKSSLPTETRKSVLRRARELGAHEWADLVVAVGELAVARLKLAWSNPEPLLDARPARGTGKVADAGGGRLGRVSKAIARASHRVPWRADCLVQALAARRWLSRQGIRTDLVFGVRPPAGTSLDAHAWLTCGDVVVTGGDVAEFVPLSPRSKH